MTLSSWARKPGRRPAQLWALSGPLRLLAAARWLPRGRGLGARIAQRIAWGTVQPGTAIEARTPAGCRVMFGSDSLIGRALWTFGTFEHAEVAAAGRLARRGTCAIDVGANVGLFTVDMSREVGADGLVIAVEPVPSTVEQLRTNLQRNGCANVEVVVGAAGSQAGEIELLLSDDAALHSAGGLPIPGHAILGSTIVPSFRLDDLWASAGTPRVAVVKIDVEGGELGVLVGAAKLISACRPALLVEIHGQERLDEVITLLPGYRTEKVAGFEPWNHLFVPA